MKLLKIFFVLFVCVWLFATEGCEKCLALTPCSVRARFIPSEAKEGFSKCVCINRFYGKNCRFKDYNFFPQKEPPEGNDVLENEAQHGAWKLDASWHHRSALIKLRLGDFKERNDKVVKYRLTYRRVRYFEDVMRNDNWKKLTNSTFNHTRSVLKLPKIEIYKILLSNASSYEINLSTFFESGRVTSTSVFLDSWNLARSGNNNFKTSAFVEPLSLPTIPVLTNAKWLEWGSWSRCEFYSANPCGNGTQVRKRQCDGNVCPGDSVEERPCELTICSARFLHVGIFETKGPNCFKNGIIIGGTGGSVGTVILIVFVYIIIRRCKSKFDKKRSDLVELENHIVFGENEESSKFKLGTVSTSSSVKKGKKHSPRGSAGFVSIAIPDGSGKDHAMIEAEACSTNKEKEITVLNRSSSVVITIAEDRNLINETSIDHQCLPDKAAVITFDTPVQLASSVCIEIPETNGSPSETDLSMLAALVPCLSHASQLFEPSQVNILTLEEEPRSVIVKIEDTVQNYNMTDSSSMSSDGSSSSTSSSSVEAARAVLVTIGTGGQITQAQLP